MFLRKLVIGTAVVAAFGASTAVFAGGDEPGVPVPGTDNSGFYVRAQAGYSWAGSDTTQTLNAVSGGSSNPANPTIQSSDSNNGGFSGRLGLGYDFNQYIALEGGFQTLSPAYREINNVNVVNGPISILSGSQIVKTSLYDADLIAKLTLPLGSFFVYADGGAAYVHTEAQGATLTYTSEFEGVPTDSTPVTVWNSSNDVGYIRPEAGAGLGYNFTPSFGVDVSYSRIFGAGQMNDQNYLADINSGLFGLTYKF